MTGDDNDNDDDDDVDGDNDRDNNDNDDDDNFLPKFTSITSFYHNYRNFLILSQLP